MTTLVIFDLDGVLIDSRELHFEALNAALKQVGDQYVISKDDHLATFDGLPTTKKLKLLTEQRQLPLACYDQIWQAKQVATWDLIKTQSPNLIFRDLFRTLKARGCRIAVASNSIRETVKLALLALGLMDLVDLFVSNEDVKRQKPFPEMYWKCMVDLNVLPQDTIIIEDSHIGRKAAIDSGAHLFPVKDVADTETCYPRLKDLLDRLTRRGRVNIPWRDAKLNVLVPMAGAGSRFAAAGYTFPKPLVEVHGKPMIQVVVENLNIEAHFIFLVQKAHYDQYHLKYLLNLIAPNCTIIQVEGITEGAACTTLLAKAEINTDAPLLLANSDQWVEWNSNECLYAFAADQIDGGILTFEATHPKWSYVKTDETGLVSEVAEKQVISTQATVGIYYWSHGSDYVKYAEQMIAKDIRTNGEFYVCPTFNEAILDGKKIRVKQVSRMMGLGTPEDLQVFVNEGRA